MLNNILLKNKIEYENDHLHYIHEPIEILHVLKILER